MPLRSILAATAQAVIARETFLKDAMSIIVEIEYCDIIPNLTSLAQLQV